MAMISVPAGAKKVEMQLVVLDVNGNPKEGVPVTTIVWHRNPFIHLLLNIGLFLNRVWFRVKYGTRKLWRKVWQQS